MTAYDVDVDELRSAVSSLAGCQRDLLALAADVDALQVRLQGGWAGLTADAQSSAHAAWRADCADMVSALAALRGLASAADEHYATAVTSNLELWRRVAP